MLSFFGKPAGVVAVEACDMRKGFGTPRKLDVSSGWNSHPGKEREPFHPESSLGLIEVTR
jgi:hypothetical protein